jgi:hypothetical protein
MGYRSACGQRTRGPDMRASVLNVHRLRLQSSALRCALLMAIWFVWLPLGQRSCVADIEAYTTCQHARAPALRLGTGLGLLEQGVRPAHYIM